MKAIRILFVALILSAATLTVVAVTSINNTAVAQCDRGDGC